jgi:hypothetical protein
MSRSNIYLYFGRFFALAFNALIAVRIEHGDSAALVIGGLCVGFILSAVLHFIFLRGNALTWVLMDALRRLLVLPAPSQKVSGRPHPIQWSLALSTAATSFAFSLGFSVPLCLAVLFPAYRMSLSYIGQLINASGTLLLLFYVDQRLFRALDRDELLHELPSYSAGRMIGFIGAGVSCYLFQALSTVIV